MEFNGYILVYFIKHGEENQGNNYKIVTAADKAIHDSKLF